MVADVRRRFGAGELALMAASIAACVLLLELGLRIHYWLRDAGSLEDLAGADSEAPSDGRTVTLGEMLVASRYPRLVYQLRPHLDVRFGGVRVRTNSAGWRDHELSPEPPSNQLRIVVIGDSVVFGWGVEAHERFTNLLEQGLAAAHPNQPWEVMPLAAPGYNLVMEAEAFRRFGLPLRPALLIYGHVSNDDCLPNFVVPRRPLWALDSFIRLYLEEGGMPSVQLVGRGGLDPTAQEGTSTVPGDFCEPSSVPPAYRHLVGEEAFRTELSELQATAHAAGIPLIVLNLSRSARVLERRLLPAGTPYVDLLASRRAFLARHGVEVPYAESELVLGNGDKHPSATGHRLVADELLQYLEESGWIDRILPQPP
jgi:hypothetical protein